MTTSKRENVKVEKLNHSHRTIYTDILIDATPEQVWSVLTDTASYKDWATFMVDIQGEIKDGSTITVVFQINPTKEKLNIIEHRISVEEGKEFYWAEKVPGGIKDNHHFSIEPTEDGNTRFVQSDEIKGGISFIAGRNLSKMYAEGYQAFNRKLKAEVERRFSKKSPGNIE